MQRKEWTQRKNASLSLIYVFISIYILKSYKCTLVKYCECTKSSKICSKDSFSSQPEQLKIQSTPTPSKDTGFIGVIKPPKQSNAGHGELSKVPPSTECCQPLAHVGATFSQLQRPNLSTAGWPNSAKAKPHTAHLLLSHVSLASHSALQTPGFPCLCWPSCSGGHILIEEKKKIKGTGLG